ncbi:MAG: hypothetical protein AAFV49_16255, partial [Pseudomonadota bacterium]
MAVAVDWSRVVIRPAVPADAEAIASLHAQAWRDTYGPLLPEGALPDTLEEDRQRLWPRVLAPTARLQVVLVATFGGRLLG